MRAEHPDTTKTGRSTRAEESAANISKITAEPFNASIAAATPRLMREARAKIAQSHVKGPIADALLILTSPTRSEQIERKVLLSSLSASGKFFREPRNFEAEAAYRQCVHNFVHRQKDQGRELEVSPTEGEFGRSLRRATRLTVLSSVLVANVVLDFLFPSIGSSGHKKLEWIDIVKGKTPESSPGKFAGLAAEIDGAIHDFEQTKISKDEHKYDVLRALGIAVTSISNRSARDPHLLRKFAQELRQSHYRLDSKTQKHLMQKIYIVTIAYQSEDSMLKKLFGVTSSDLVSAVSALRRHRASLARAGEAKWI
jgi:hypothetical protein